MTGACRAVFTSRWVEACTIPVRWAISPLVGKTTDWRAGCGRSARPVRREGRPKPIGFPYPYQFAPCASKLAPVML